MQILVKQCFSICTKMSQSIYKVSRQNLLKNIEKIEASFIKMTAKLSTYTELMNAEVHIEYARNRLLCSKHTNGGPN